MFVQDDQIRFAQRDLIRERRVVRGESCICTCPPLGRCRVQGFGRPWHIVRVGSRARAESLLLVFFPLMCEVRCDMRCVMIVLWEGCMLWNGGVQEKTRGYQLTTIRHLMHSLMYALHCQSRLRGIHERWAKLRGVH